jgi:hypothetical protein
MNMTRVVSRSEVKPGMLVKHKGKIWRASVNIKQGLYLHSVSDFLKYTHHQVEIILDHRGNPETGQ